MTRIEVRKIGLAVAAALAPAAHAQQVTYSPYIQLGDNGSFSESANSPTRRARSIRAYVA